MADSIKNITKRHEFFSPWQYPSYRLLWISALFSYTGRWIETTVTTWIILELTNSPLAVGLLGTSRWAAMLLGPFCGTLADLFSRRLILLAVQIVYATGALIIMALFLVSQLEVWHLFVFALVAGLCYTFDLSTRYATAADVTQSQHILSAISMLILAMGVTSILGPLVGGNLLGVIGASGCFALITSSFFLSFLALFLMKIKRQASLVSNESMWKNLVDGLRYVKNDKTLFSLILIAALVNLFIFPYWTTLIPVFARDILHTEASGYGLLMAAVGLGAIIGSLATALLPDFVNKGRLLIVTVFVWPAVLMIFSVSRLFPLSMVLLVCAGVAQGISMALIQALLLIHSSDEMRGRVSGARAFAIGTLPLGSFLAGAGASLWSAPIVLIINASSYILITIFIVIWAPELRKWK